MESNFLPVVAGIATLGFCLVSARVLSRFNLKEKVGSQERLGCIDGLRGFLALGVFLHHFIITYQYNQTGIWQRPSSVFFSMSGQIGVMLFFMVTGFLFWNKILGSGGNLNWRKLYVSRIFRLTPLYWFTVAIVVGFALFGDSGIHLRTTTASLAKSIATWLLYVGRLDINGFTDTRRVVANVVWTLKYEWLFYLSLPLLAALMRFSKKRKAVLWILTACVIGISIRGFNIPHTDLETRFFIYFLVGALSAAVDKNEFARKIACSRPASILCLASLVLLLTLFPTADGNRQLCLLALFFAPIALGNSMFGVLKTRAAIVLGEISYSIYLLHGIVLYVFFSVLFPNLIQPSTPALVEYGLMLSLGACVVVISWCAFNCIENPGIHVGRGIAARLDGKHG